MESSQDPRCLPGGPNMIAVKCPHCQAGIRGDDRHAGHVVACPSCKKRVRLSAMAQPLSAKAAVAQSPPPFPEAEPASPADDGLSFLTGGSASASSSSYSGSSPSWT